jgi:hypothetical protein
MRLREAASGRRGAVHATGSRAPAGLAVRFPPPAMLKMDVVQAEIAVLVRGRAGQRSRGHGSNGASALAPSRYS